MSAFDIAGAVVWTLLALFSVGCLATPTRPDLNGRWFLILISTLLASIYCIARLFGASA